MGSKYKEYENLDLTKIADEVRQYWGEQVILKLEVKTMLEDYNVCNVMVVDGRCNGKCSIKGCKNKAKYWLFADDGIPKMSRLYSFSCDAHLALSVRKVNAYNVIHKLEKQNRMRRKK